jgi:hypothetical protein
MKMRGVSIQETTFNQIKEIAIKNQTTLSNVAENFLQLGIGLSNEGKEFEFKKLKKFKSKSEKTEGLTSRG